MKIIENLICIGTLFVLMPASRADMLFLSDLSEFKESSAKFVKPGQSIMAEFSDCKSKGTDSGNLTCKLKTEGTVLHLLVTPDEAKGILGQSGKQHKMCHFVKIEETSATCTTVESVSKKPSKSENKSKLWTHEQEAVADFKKMADNNFSGWLLANSAMQESQYFREANKIIDQAENLNAITHADFCIGTFIDSPSVGRHADALCIKTNQLSPGASNCLAYGVGLASGEILKQPFEVTFTACDRDSAIRAIRMAGATMYLEDELYNGGFNGSLGIYLFKDKFKTMKYWIDSAGPVNDPKKKKVHKKRHHKDETPDENDPDYKWK